MYVLWSRDLKRFLHNKKGDLIMHQDKDRARKSAASLQASVYKSRNVGIEIVECRLNEVGHFQYRRSKRSKNRDKQQNSS